MTQIQNPLSPEKKRRLIIFGLIPVFLLLFAIMIYIQISKKNDGKLPSPKKLNTSIPEKQNKDTVTNKTDLYGIIDAQEKKDSEGKAVFNAGGKLNLNMNVESNDALEKRLKEEVVQPNEGGNQTIARPRLLTQGTIPTRNEKEDDGSDDRAFNSISLNSQVSKKQNNYSDLKNAIQHDINCPAEVLTKATVSDGGTVSLRLREDIVEGEQTLVAGTIVSGLARIEQNRIKLSISSINVDNKILFVKLTAYDKKDGIEGLKMQGNTNLKRGARQTIDEQVSSLGTDVESQIAPVGGRLVEGVIRNIIRTRGKTDEATIPEGYQVILKSN